MTVKHRKLKQNLQQNIYQDSMIVKIIKFSCISLYICSSLISIFQHFQESHLNTYKYFILLIFNSMYLYVSGNKTKIKVTIILDK